MSEPEVVGAKCPWMVQFDPGARVEPQLLTKTYDEAFTPVTVMLPMFSVALPVLVRVTDCDALLVPTFWLPNERLVAERATAGARATPVPLRAMLCGESLALSVMVMAAVIAPPVIGVKWP